MELPDLGDNCGIETCKQLDFLPILCTFCLKNYCQHHNLPDQHNCKNKPKISIGSVSILSIRNICNKLVFKLIS